MQPLTSTIALMIVLFAVMAQAADQPAFDGRNVQIRDSLRNSEVVFTTTDKGHVAFIGGSITEMNGYRPLLATALQKTFPQTKFTFTAAGIASTCSTTGAHRLKDDVLGKGPVDLIFIEFAVNDDQDAAHARRDAVRGLEGILRQCRAHNPKMDIIVTFFVNENMLDLYSKGKTAISLEAHEAVCAHYDVTSVNLAKEVSQRIEAKQLTWKDFGGVHPGPTGNQLAATMCLYALESSWKLSVKKPGDYGMPKEPLDVGHYGNGRFVEVKEAKLGEGWTVSVPDWKQIPGSFRDRFGGQPVLMATTPGASVSLAFEGQAVGVYVLAGPDAGLLEVSVDDGEWVTVNLFHQFSKGLHYPRTVMLATDLERGKHVVRIRISEQRHKESKGTAARILKFAVN